MKRCPKCNRTYTDDNQKFCTHDGGRLTADQDAPTSTDLNKTVMGTPYDIGSPFDATQVDAPAPASPPPVQPPPAPSKPDDLISTLPGNTPIPTSDFRRAGETGPTTSAPTSASLSLPPNVVPTAESLPPPPPAPTSMALPPPPVYAPEPAPQQMPTQQTQQTQQQPVTYQPQAAATPPKRKSKLPLILGGLAVLLVLGVAALAAIYIFVVKPRMEASNKQQTRPVVVTNENTNTNTGTANTNTNESSTSNSNGSENLNVGGGSFEAPPNSKKFVNSNAKLDGKLAEHYVDFSFYYPENWTLDANAGAPGASNFVGVGRKLPPNFPQEYLNVSWYDSKGTIESDRDGFQKLVSSYSDRISKLYPDYKLISQGETKVNSLDGYEFRFQGQGVTDKGDTTYWGRVIFLPPGKDGEKNGVTLLMLTTSLAPELSGVNDVGVKGQLPMILSTFKFGKE